MKSRILNFLLLLIPYATIFAQVPPPPTEGGDGAGGPGAPGTPIDQYQIVLILVAVLFAAYYMMSYKKLVKN